MSDLGPGEYATRDGCKAVVECVLPQPHEDYDLQGRVLCKDGCWEPSSWMLSGHYLKSGKQHRLDLVQPTPDELKKMWEKLLQAQCLLSKVIDLLGKAVSSE